MAEHSDNADHAAEYLDRKILDDRDHRAIDTNAHHRLVRAWFDVQITCARSEARQQQQSKDVHALGRRLIVAITARTNSRVHDSAARINESNV